MSHENQGHDRIRALEAELARVQSERASMDARIRLGQLEEHAPSSRRADVLAWSAFFVAAALVATLIVTLAQQAPVVRESTRVETVIVPDTTPAPVAVVPTPTPVAGSDVEAGPRRTTDRTRPERPARETMTDLLGDDRCGSDPTCGI